jgi:hypothetical protein
MAPAPLVVALATAMLADECEQNGCLRFVRKLYGHQGVTNRVPALNFTPGNFKVPFAAEAWENATVKHKPRAGTTPKAPPVGVPVWWSGAPSGHVAISAGHGYVISTDWPRAMQVNRVSIKEVTRAWGKTYRGWTEDINDVTVFVTHDVHLPGIKRAAEAQDPTQEIAPKSCLLVNAALYVEGLLGDRHALDEYLSARAVHAYRRWQQQNGVQGTGVPDRRTLAKLGRRNGFRVATEAPN